MKKAHSPAPLPPKLDSLYVPEFILLLGKANRELARLGELPNLLPNTGLAERLAAPLLKKEAILSSKIEGTQTTLSELYKHEAQIYDIENQDEEAKQAKEVENYVRAMHRGMTESEEKSLSLGTLRHMHNVLLTGVRNDQGIPGEFRNFDAYIGPKGTPVELATYIASPPEKIKELMGQFEIYLHSSAIEDPIIQCALLHYQFEAVHPFGDGNGRIGRLLIPLFFYYKKIIKYPLIYISEYFEKNHEEYYEKLQNVTDNNDWDGWIKFFLEGIILQSKTTFDRGEAIIELYKKYHDRDFLKLQSPYSLPLIQHIFQFPFTAAPFLATKSKMSQKTARSLLENMADRGLLKTSSGFYRKYRVKVYEFSALLNIINK